MFVFSKNLYDKIVIVYTRTKLSLLVVSILVWSLSLPFALIAIFTLKLSDPTYFYLYYKIYACLKFVIVSTNAVIYVKIFYVAFKKRMNRQRNISDISKTAFMAFLLVITTCLQVFITDVLSLFNITVSVKIFGVINSFHAVLITIIFITILRAKMRESDARTTNVTMTELSNDCK
ncbi:unnamed protein product [Diatraea saccharalis]|uniref:Uncharacterized protein n=1 Tax=Diatraea saccharalis TaxID=40085 RepID=A0A9N9R1W7_9NEOP|nr:unnamed protein product [Diatraea saccharalis]